ncbi:MAG: phenylalanine--tRNA ligase subunit alpha [Candidatus Schekmanbacteria bacterium]|nr:phenylalanine--tRNA ligase subunit alpha [Candidatus Schekmanbacteria bacterium]
MREELNNLLPQLTAELAQISQLDQLSQLKVKYLGRKGPLSAILRKLGALSAEDRPMIGQLANIVKTQMEEKLAQAEISLAARHQDEKLAQETIDITLPGRVPEIGRIHPITKTIHEVCAIFQNLGFQIAEGPEIETDFYNFEALNIPAHHPARDMHDTFYLQNNLLLRTHTSPVQIRVMEKQAPPLRIIAPGKVYRRDADITHTPMFHQVEGLLVDKTVAFSDLKGTLTVFIQRMFGAGTALRFRPSYFPFTEPSAEVDIACVICSSRGCRVCKGSGWLEILGAGMVDPAVFRMVNYDPEEYTGFAFGMGIERIAMLKYGVDDIRLFFENDLRFLRQF